MSYTRRGTITCRHQTITAHPRGHPGGAGVSTLAPRAPLPWSRECAGPQHTRQCSPIHQTMFRSAPDDRRWGRVTTGGGCRAPLGAPSRPPPGGTLGARKSGPPVHVWTQPPPALGRGAFLCPLAEIHGRIVCTPWCFPLGPGVRSPVVRGSPDVGIEVADQPIAAFRAILSAPQVGGLVGPPSSEERR